MVPLGALASMREAFSPSLTAFPPPSSPAP